MLRTLFCSPALKGLDIGGTVAKLVLATPEDEHMDSCPHSGALKGCHDELELQCELGDSFCVLRFFSGATAMLGEALSSMAQGSDDSDEDSIGDEDLGGLSRLVSRESLGESLTFPESEASSGSIRSLDAGQLPVAGGGAHKFASVFQAALGIEVVTVGELAAVVDGLLFLAEHGPRSGQLFSVDPHDGEPAWLPWPEQLFPFMLVSMGSGVSIVRVDSPSVSVRVGGTACGGGTFLGLVRALTSAKTFKQALRLAEGGNAAKCDLLVRDIYGEGGAASLGLPERLTASNCGRLCEAAVAEEDVALSLLQMVTQQSILLASALAQHAGCQDRVFFVGGFLQDNSLSRAAICASFNSFGGTAYFLRHAQFLGALGSLRAHPDL